MKINSVLNELNNKNYYVTIIRNNRIIKIQNFNNDNDFCIVDPNTIVNNQISVQKGQDFNSNIIPLIEKLISQEPIIFYSYEKEEYPRG